MAVSLMNIREIKVDTTEFNEYVINMATLKGAYGNALLSLMYRFQNLDKSVKIIVQSNELVTEEDVELGIFKREDIGQISGFVFATRYGGIFSNIDVLLIQEKNDAEIPVNKLILPPNAFNIVLGVNLLQDELLKFSLSTKSTTVFISYIDSKGTYAINTTYVTPKGIYYNAENQNTEDILNIENATPTNKRTKKVHNLGYNLIGSSLIFNIVNTVITDELKFNYLSLKGDFNTGVTQKEFVDKFQEKTFEISRLTLLLNKDGESVSEHNTRIYETLANTLSTGKLYRELLLETNTDFVRTLENQSVDVRAIENETVLGELKQTYKYLRKVLQLLKEMIDSERNELLQIAVLNKLYSSDEDIQLFKRIYRLVNSLIHDGGNNQLYNSWFNNNGGVNLEVYTLLVFINEYYGNFNKLANELILIENQATA